MHMKTVTIRLEGSSETDQGGVVASGLSVLKSDSGRSIEGGGEVSYRDGTRGGGVGNQTGDENILSCLAQKLI